MPQPFPALLIPGGGKARHHIAPRAHLRIEDLPGRSLMPRAVEEPPMDGCRPQIHGQPERARIRPYVHPFPLFGRRRRQLNNHTRNGGMAAGQPPAAAHGLRAEDGAIRVARLGRPFKKPYPARPAAPEPRTQRGRGQFAGQPDRLGKRLPRFHRKDVVEAG